MEAMTVTEGHGILIPMISAPIDGTTVMILLVGLLRGGGKGSSARRMIVSIPPPSTGEQKGTYEGAFGDHYHKVSNHFYNFWPQPLRFFVSGNLGNVVFFALERLLYSLLNHKQQHLPPFLVKYMDGASFMGGYFLHIIVQHWLHAFLVYGMHTINAPDKYFKTLIACYSTYMSSMVGSTVLNTTLIRWGLNRTLAFVLTLWLFACINFTVLRIIHGKGSTTPTDDTSAASSTSMTCGSTSRGIAQTGITHSRILHSLKGGASASVFVALLPQIFFIQHCNYPSGKSSKLLECSDF